METSLKLLGNGVVAKIDFVFESLKSLAELEKQLLAPNPPEFYEKPATVFQIEFLQPNYSKNSLILDQDQIEVLCKELNRIKELPAEKSILAEIYC